MTNREQFEAAWRERYPDHPASALKRSGLDSADYCNTRTKDAWWAWQASRETLVVELPDTVANTGTLTSGAVLGYKRECREAIEAQGLRVAP